MSLTRTTFGVLQVNIISWGCLYLSGLKDIFHWYTQFEIFSRSSSNSLVDCVTSWTTEKRDVSSAKCLVVHENPQLRSLIYIKKNKGLKTDP